MTNKFRMFWCVFLSSFECSGVCFCGRVCVVHECEGACMCMVLCLHSCVRASIRSCRRLAMYIFADLMVFTVQDRIHQMRQQWGGVHEEFELLQSRFLSRVSPLV